jgi:four helix bundle protein
MGGRSYRELEVWQLAMTLADSIYDLTATFPRHELYGLTSQMRRAAVRIPSNIAEGRRQRTGRAKAYYYNAANASQAELETQLELTRRRRTYAPEAEIRTAEELGTRVSKMLFRLVDSADRGP